MMVLTPAPPAPGDPLGVMPSGADDSMATQIVLIQSREMAQRTASEMKNTALTRGTMGSTMSPMPDDIQKSVKAANPPGTRLLTITAEAADPKQAQDLANATARAFLNYKRFLATQDMRSIQRNLERKAILAGQVLDMAERQERLSRQAAAPPPVGVSPPISAARLRQNTEVAQELYRRLQTSLEATRLQMGLGSGDVMITQYADAPKAPS